MVQQAKSAHVNMIPVGSSLIFANPVTHDKSDSILTGAPASGAEDRVPRYAGGANTTQRSMIAASGMSWTVEASQNNINMTGGRASMRVYNINMTVEQ